jgi:UDP-N-acetylglucosamine--dolichyl-phosphate N-acetylglucosaminephosphotransferase
MEPLLFVGVLFGFLLTLLVTPVWIKSAKRVGLTGKDMNKPNKREVAEAGGISVLLGFILGVLSYIFLKTFYFKSQDNLIEIFAILTSILIVGVVGLIDDLLGWKIGLNKKVRISLLIFAAIPLIVINAGESTMMGISFGVFYPLFLIPLGVVATSSTFNFVAGYNGLEASQGAIILTALAIATFFTGTTWLSLILIIMVACILAFLIFNKHPADVFPGDVFTYSVGALIGISAIFGNIEKFAIFIFIPYILEVILKSRGKLKIQSFAKINSDGTLEKPNKKYYGIEHIAIDFIKKIKGSARENEVVLAINFFQIILIILAFIIFRGFIF